MFSVLFEVRPVPERFDDYLALAARLRPMLERIDGFIDNERFRSLRRPGWLLSHSTWRDEKAVVRWRTQGGHHGAQAQGRAGIFGDYRLRVGDVLADSAPPAGGAVRPQRFDATEAGTAPFATLTELVLADGEDAGDELAAGLPGRLGLDPASTELVDADVFAGLLDPRRMAVLASWRSAEGAGAWSPGAASGMAAPRQRRMRIVRDYGLRDRREAPQYFPEPGDGAASAPR